jgi:hypothetical protein
MDAREFIQIQIAAARRFNDSVMQDLADDPFNWCPPGTANPISSTFLHIVAGEDLFIQTLLQGKPRLWESQGWAARIGVQATPGRGQGWDEVRNACIPLGPLLEYQVAVRAATDAYLTTLSASELERLADFPGGARRVAEVLAILAVHILGHSGEIAAIKGTQGLKGLPF